MTPHPKPRTLIGDVADRLEAERLLPIPRLASQRRRQIVLHVADDATAQAARRAALLAADDWWRKHRKETA